MPGTLSVAIFLQEGVLMMSPSVNDGDGFVAGGAELFAEPSDSEALGRVAREALTHAR